MDMVEGDTLPLLPACYPLAYRRDSEGGVWLWTPRWFAEVIYAVEAAIGGELPPHGYLILLVATFPGTSAESLRLIVTLSDHGGLYAPLRAVVEALPPSPSDGGWKARRG